VHFAPRKVPFGKHAFSEAKHELLLPHMFETQAGTQNMPAASEHVSALLTA
jgi:hypothetical protein